MIGGGDGYVNEAGGKTYFKVLYPYEELVGIYERAFAIRRQYQTIELPIAVLKARLVGVLIQDMIDAVRITEVETAKVADEAIKTRIRQTQVRPQGKRTLINSVGSAPLFPGSKLPTGGVGVGDIDLLDKAADEQGRPYWAAQEFGSRHLVNKTIRGLFQPGGVPADPSRFREQSSFSVVSGGPLMTIKRPIRARGFLRAGVGAGELFRQRALSAMADEAVTAGTRIRALGE